MLEMPKVPKAINHLLEGPVTKSIFKIATPIILANILMTAYQLIDTFWVGRLGVNAVAAVSLSFPIIFFLNSLAMGFTIAGSILIAQYNGKGEKRNVDLIVGQTVSFVVLVALLLSAAGYFSSGFALSFLTSDAAVLPEATIYLQISFLTMVATFIYTIFQSALRGVGEVKLPMIIILITVILNFILDPIFMLGYGKIPAMGVVGVAWATFITEMLSAVIGIVILLRGKHGVKLFIPDLKLQMKWIKRIFALGLPSSIEMSTRSLGMVLMTLIVSTFGTLVVAAYGIGVKILSFIIIPAMGFAMATSALVGNNLGAKQHSRVEKIAKAGMKISFTMLTFLGLITFFFATQIATFLVPTDSQLITMAASFIRIMALTFGFVGMQMIVISTIRSAGEANTAMLLALFQNFILFVAAYLLSTVMHLGEIGLWWAYPTSNFFAVVLALYYYQKKDWLKKELV
jgi:putative MATE family efflux protein